MTPIALAQDGDGAAVGKITLLNRKAVESYHRLEFDTAVGLLNEALNLSETAGLTQHPIRARTFVTLGIVTLGGFKQREQAVKYFRKALQIQPEVRLSPGLANPDIQAAFDEAISGLANSSADDLPPDKALVHEPVRTGQAGQPVVITVMPDKDLESSAVILRYRAAAASSFTDLPMLKGMTAGALEASIPASATTGSQVAYFIEARRANGSVLVARGSAADPMVVALASAKPVEPVTTSPSPARAEPRRFHFALVGGTGLGLASGTGEATRASMASSGVAWTHSGQVAPEVGYLVTDHLMVGLQARLQLVTGAMPYHIPQTGNGECGDDGVCSPAKGAFAGLLKATWFFAEPDSAFQPYVSLSAGGGSIRHVAKVTGAQTCGMTGAEPCVDTMLGGPALFGPGVGFRYLVSDAVGIVAEIGGLIGAPKFVANADLNVGVAFQL